MKVGEDGAKVVLAAWWCQKKCVEVHEKLGGLRRSGGVEHAVRWRYVMEMEVGYVPWMTSPSDVPTHSNQIVKMDKRRNI